MTTEARRAPLRIALVNDHEVVVRGLQALLADRSEDVEVVEMVSQLPVSQRVDLALYDAFTMDGADGEEVRDLLSNPLVGGVAIYTWNVQPDVVEQARRRGVRAVLSKTLRGDELVDALIRTREGGFAVVPSALPVDVVEDLQVRAGDWPGRQHGLTAREAEVIALIASGLSNHEIAERIHLSINSIKSYIRTAYRRMDVTTRSQAVLWALDHDMVPRPNRLVPRPGRNGDAAPGH